MSSYLTPYEQSESLTMETDSSIASYDPHESVLANSIYAENEAEQRLVEEFLKLKEKWLHDTQFESGYKALINHPAFLKIVTFGEKIIPYLVKDMVENKIPWFYALNEITRENPIRQESRGKIDLVIEDWRRWADENDYV